MPFIPVAPIELVTLPNAFLAMNGQEPILRAVLDAQKAVADLNHFIVDKRVEGSSNAATVAYIRLTRAAELLNAARLKEMRALVTDGEG
jgi:hypothetical protein